MISSEDLPYVAIVLTERKLLLCKKIKEILVSEGISKSDKEIVNAINTVSNTFFLTDEEKKTNRISGNKNVLDLLIQQHPRLPLIIHEKLLS